MSRAAQVAIGLYVAWLVVFVLLLASDRVDRDIVGLVGLLPIWGPLLLIAGLGGVSWLQRRRKRR